MAKQLAYDMRDATIDWYGKELVMSNSIVEQAMRFQGWL